MQDYEAIDLSPWCNAGPEWCLPGEVLSAGTVFFRGIPFRLGTENETSNVYLGFGPGGYVEPITIPIHRRARWVIFAHRLMESHILEGEAIGRVVATYRFGYNDGSEATVPIRERFEVSIVPLIWGQLPLLAVPDEQDWLRPRLHGPWEQAGYRLAEVEQGYPRRFVLWPWKNPHPEQELATLTIIPQNRKFLLAAVTVSPLEEEPFAVGPHRPLKIVLRDPQQAAESFDLAVHVDRGAAAHPYPLPGGTAADFLKSDLHGWGQPYNGNNSPAYVDIAAQPSASVRIESRHREIASVRWGDLLGGNTVVTDAVSLQVVDPGLNWVHVRVLDEFSGNPIPCRVHFRSPDGIPYQPHGHHNHLLSDQETWHIDVGGDVRLGHVTYAYINGTCQGWLPRGEVLVDIARGYEYEPLRTQVLIEPGQRELTLRLKRWTNLNAERWFSGDTHVHFLSTAGAHLEAQGEDLNVVNLLQSQWGHLFTNSEDFVGRPVVSPDGRTIVYTSQENRQHLLGHLSLLGLRKPVVPWCSDGPGEAELGGLMETTLCHWADDCHAQGGTVIVSHLPNPNCEAAALIATGRADAVEMLAFGKYEHLEYYRYLNAGYRLPLVGGTDKMTASVPVGIYRTYVWIPPEEEFNYESWCRGLREGRTFLSGGPILRFSVEGARIGDTIHLKDQGGTIEAEADAESIFPIHCLQIVASGRVVASTEEPQGARRLHLKTKIKVTQNAWLAARVSGPSYLPALLHHDDWQRGIMAHTSPIYVAVGREWSMYDAGAAEYMVTLIQGSIEYVEKRFSHQTQGSRTHHHGQEDHLAYLQRPLREALEAVKARRR